MEGKCAAAIANFPPSETRFLPPRSRELSELPGPRKPGKLLRRRPARERPSYHPLAKPARAAAATPLRRICSSISAKLLVQDSQAMTW